MVKWGGLTGMGRVSIRIGCSKVSGKRSQGRAGEEGVQRQIGCSMVLVSACTSDVRANPKRPRIGAETFAGALKMPAALRDLQ